MSKCPLCGWNGYQGFNHFECDNPKCDNHAEPKDSELCKMTRTGGDCGECHGCQMPDEDEWGSFQRVVSTAWERLWTIGHLLDRELISHEDAMKLLERNR